MTEQDEHKAKMERLKASVDRRIEAAQEEKGLLIVYTGAGKGKTTAALGMVLRCIGHGLKVAVVQFIKGAIDTAEERALKSFGDRVTSFGWAKDIPGKLKIVSETRSLHNRRGKRLVSFFAIPPMPWSSWMSSISRCSTTMSDLKRYCRCFAIDHRCSMW